MKHHLKSFTLLELVVALAISTIVVAIAYSCYAIVGNNFLKQKEKNSQLHNLHLINSLIKTDFENCVQVNKVNETLINIEFPEKSIYYNFENDYIIRNENEIGSDTFMLSINDVNIVTLLTSSPVTTVQELSLETTFLKHNYTLNYKKEYAADFLLKHEQ